MTRWNGWLAGLAAAAIAAAIVQARSRKAERDNPPSGRFVEVEGVRLHYVERGRGPPLVLLHGNSSFNLDFVISSLVAMAAARYRVLVFDRPGYGYSDRLAGRAGSPEAQARLIHAALRRVGVEEAIVLGHSWGALVAIAMALDFPRFVRGLILESGFLYPEPRMDMALLSRAATPVVGTLIRHTFFPLAARAVWRSVVALLFAPGPVPGHFLGFPSWMVLRPSQMRTSLIELGLASPCAARLSRRYDQLRVPTVGLVGRGDKLVGPKAHSARLHANVPHIHYRVIEGAGHMLHHTHPREVLEGIDTVARRGSDAMS